MSSDVGERKGLYETLRNRDRMTHRVTQREINKDIQRKRDGKILTENEKKKYLHGG